MPAARAATRTPGGRHRTPSSGAPTAPRRSPAPVDAETPPTAPQAPPDAPQAAATPPSGPGSLRRAASAGRGPAQSSFAGAVALGRGRRPVSLAGFLGGMVAWALALQLIRGGPGGLSAWFAAKFWNGTSPATPSGLGPVAPSSLALSAQQIQQQGLGTSNAGTLQQVYGPPAGQPSPYPVGVPGALSGSAALGQLYGRAAGVG